MNQMNGKVVWITGASSGIGLALAKAYSQKGAYLIVSARRLELLEELLDYFFYSDLLFF